MCIMATSIKCVLVIGVLGTLCASQLYHVPEAQVEVLKPQGFRVSIPDDEGIELLGFHASINEELIPVNAGQIAEDVLKKNRDDRWTYTNDKLALKKGDVMTYWLYVLYDGIGYQSKAVKYTVGDSIADEEITTNPPIVESKKDKHKNDEDKNRKGPTSSSSQACEEVKLSLKNCEKVTDNALESLKTARAEIDRLRQLYNNLQQQVTNHTVTILPQGLVLGGNLPEILDSGAQHLVNFILWEKLYLTNLEALKAIKNSNGSISFEMYSPEEKTQVLAAAKKYMKNSTIFIKDVNETK